MLAGAMDGPSNIICEHFLDKYFGCPSNNKPNLVIILSSNAAFLLVSTKLLQLGVTVTVTQGSEDDSVHHSVLEELIGTYPDVGVSQHMIGRGKTQQNIPQRFSRKCCHNDPSR